MTWPANAFNDRNKPSIRLAAISLNSLISNSLHSEVIARRLIHLADAAYFNRRYGELGHVSELLGCMHRYNSIAAYYQGIVAQSKQNHNQATELFRYTLSTAPREYRSRALVSLGATDLLTGNLRACHYAQALRMADASMTTRFKAAFGISQVYALSGEHHRAIESLESIYPIARRLAALNPRLYYDALNSLAVEYAEVGRHEDARAAFKPVRNSFLFSTIAEFQETDREIQELDARPVIVAVSVPEPTRKVIVAMCLLFLTARRSYAKQVLKPFTNPAPNTTSRIVRCSPIHGPPSLSGSKPNHKS
jgi:tetratricopeptide (TPR) repeat protein